MGLDKNMPQNLLHMNCLIVIYVIWIKIKHLFVFFFRFIKSFLILSVTLSYYVNLIIMVSEEVV